MEWTKRISEQVVRAVFVYRWGDPFLVAAAFHHINRAFNGHVALAIMWAVLEVSVLH